MNRFGPRALHLLADNSMVVVLLVLCTVLSIVTYREQEPDGASAGDLVADAILNSGQGQRVLILASTAQEDDAFVRQLRQRLVDGNALVVDAVQGEPRASRQVIKRLHDEGGGVDAIACSARFAKVARLLLEDLPTDFPKLVSAQVVKPENYLGPTFLKRSNLLNIANQTAVIAIVAIGMTMVIIAGGIDLSVGSLIGLSAVTTTLLIEAAGGLEASLPLMVLSSLAGIVSCGLFGAGTGALITLLRVPPFIVTLAMMLVASGLALNLTGGQSVFAIPESYMWLGRGTGLFNLPNAVLLMLVLYLLAQAIMSQTTLGRYFYAVGGNAEAARLSGVPVQPVVLLAYVFSGLLAGLGGVIMASQLKSGSPTYGAGYELSVIAAVVVGGTSLSGGEGSMFGTLLGAFLIAVIQNGMNLVNTNPFTQKIVLGVVILTAVLLDRIKHRWLYAG